MSEWWLIGLLVLVTVIACVLIVYPLRGEHKITWVLILFTPILAFTGYYYCGGFAPLSQYIHQQESHLLAQHMLKSIKSPEELIEKLKTKLDMNPKSAKGWYLLGKLYSSQDKKSEALEAFALAHQLNPDEEEFFVHYAHGLWLKNNQQFSPEIREQFLKLLKNNPNQPDALAMLAMDAYMSQAYENAIGYWQRLLNLAPPQSEEAMAIRKAIAKAQQNIRATIP